MARPPEFFFLSSKYIFVVLIESTGFGAQEMFIVPNPIIWTLGRQVGVGAEAD